MRQNVSLPRVVYEYEDVFPDELLRLPPPRNVDIDSCHGRVIWNQQYLFPIFLLLP